jgi:hypothetical protein
MPTPINSYEFTVAVPLATFEALQAKLVAQGLFTVGTTEGMTPSHDGVELQYRITTDTAQAVIQFWISRKPFFVSNDTVEAHVRSLVAPPTT